MRSSPVSPLRCSSPVGVPVSAQAHTPKLSPKLLFEASLPPSPKSPNLIAENLKLLNENLLEAVQENNFIRVIEAINNGADPHEFEDNEGHNLLYVATINRCDLNLIKFLISKGLNVDEFQKKHLLVKSTCLSVAIQNNLTEIALLYIKMGSDVNFAPKNFVKQSMLHFAIEKELTEIACALIKAGANIMQVNQYKDTPLHVAIKSLNIEVVDALMAAGAKIDVKGHDHKTAKDLARIAYSEWNLDSEYKIKCMRILTALKIDFIPLKI